MCYVMNITQSDVRATLRFDHHWKHYQKRSGTDETTVTYGATETTRVLISSSHRGPQTMRNSYFPSTDTIRTICPRTCKNGGECKLF
uniref:Uncharacterized protein n=1 Tax=Ciona savignyi TaxID=51511 RepID=H2YCT1_CIOSA